MGRASTVLVAVAVALVCVWPPADDRRRAIKVVNWTVNPSVEQPVPPGPVALGAGDDTDVVAAHDMQVQAYDTPYAKGGWTRRRLEWKVARDPLNPATERQVILALGIVTAFVFWRVNRRSSN